MTTHIPHSDIELLVRNDLDATECARVHRHLFECDSCLRRLIDFEAQRAATEWTDRKRRGTLVQPRAAVRAYVY